MAVNHDSLRVAQLLNNSQPFMEDEDVTDFSAARQWSI